MSAKLIDDVLPRYDFRSRHELEIETDPIGVAAALEAFRLDVHASPVTRLLFGLRGLGLPRGTLREALTASSFTVLAEAPGREMVAGVLGRFWVPRERSSLLAPADAAEFVAFDRPGWAKGVMNLFIRPIRGGGTVLSTETRVLCTDERARSRFALYWAAIGPFSGWIRRDLLRGIREIALAHPVASMGSAAARSDPRMPGTDRDASRVRLGGSRDTAAY